MSALSLKNVRAIAESAVRELPGDFTIAAVLPARSAYAEVLVVGTRAGIEPTRVIVGIDRQSSEGAIRATLAANLPQ
jgi:hypothetical protein